VNDADRVAVLAGRVRELDTAHTQDRQIIGIYRDALSQIAGAESGTWGWRAHRALKKALAVQANERE
jgi:hypothetical protein